MWLGLGKEAWLYRFADAAQNFGRNKKVILTDEQPADFLCAYKGYLGLVECKSTTDPKGFRRSLIRRGQLKAAVESSLSRTPYHFAVRNENTQQVFIIPAKLIVHDASMVSWRDMVYLEWKGGRECLDLLRM